VNNARAPAVACVQAESTIDERGRRLSTFDSFLPPSLVRARSANLKLCPRTVVTSLIFKRDDGGLRAAGVMLDDDDDEESAKMPRPPRRVYARRDIILCGGTIATPHLLLLRWEA
jgi:choline dehydrogenase